MKCYVHHEEEAVVNCAKCGVAMCHVCEEKALFRTAKSSFKQKTMGDLRSGKFILAYYKIKEEQVFEYFLNTCSSLIL